MHPMTSYDLFDRHESVLELVRRQQASTRGALAVLDAWLVVLLGVHPRQKVRLYLIETMSQVLHHLEHVPPLFCAPNVYEALSVHIGQAMEELHDTFDAADVAQAHANLHRAIDTLHAWLGEDIASAPTLETDAEPEPMERLVAAITAKRVHGGADVAYLESILLQWKTMLAPSRGAVSIPLLHVEEQDDDGMGSFGLIEPLVLTPEIHPGESDIVRFINVAPTDADDDHASEILVALHAARHVAQRMGMTAAVGNLLVTGHYPAHHRSYAGRSLGLGAAASLLCSMSELQEGRNHFRINPSAAFSGRVLKDGTIVGVDDDAITDKVGTIFFSPYTTFVVPKANEVAAQTRIDELEARHPTRHLALVPVRHLSEVVQSRLAIETIQRSILQRARRRILRHSTVLLTSLFVLVVVMVAVLLVAMSDHDDVPAHVAIEYGSHVVRNAGGRILWSRPIQGDLAPDVNQQLAEPVDLDGDGRREVLLYGNGRATTDPNRLVCCNMDGSTRWEAMVGFPTVTEEQDYRGQPISITFVKILTLDSSQRKYIVVKSANIHYANFVTILDADGIQRGEYYHCGVITEVCAGWWNADGMCDLILSGTNNSFHQGVMIVLHPRLVSGHGPARAGYRLLEPEMPAACERCYIRFPQSDVFTAVVNQLNPYSLLINALDSSIVIRVDHGYIPKYLSTSMHPDGGPVNVIYTLDRRYRPVSVATSSEFDLLHRYLKSIGRIHSTCNDGYRQHLLQGVEYWDGQAFRHEPVENARFTRAMKELDGIRPR